VATKEDQTEVTKVAKESTTTKRRVFLGSIL
jgi:hypothetical protein